MLPLPSARHGVLRMVNATCICRVRADNTLLPPGAHRTCGIVVVGCAMRFSVT